MATEKLPIEGTGSIPLILGALGLISLSLAFKYCDTSPLTRLLPDALTLAGLMRQCRGFFGWHQTPQPHRESTIYHHGLWDGSSDPVLFIPPTQLHPNFIFNHYGQFYNTHLRSLEVYEIDAARTDPNNPRDYIFDFSDFELLPMFTKPTFIKVTIPSPLSSRDDGDHMWTHAVTIYISPENKKIRVNDPLCKNKTKKDGFVRFPIQIVRILENQYPEYTVIDEYMQLQFSGETICVYLAYKMGQYYAQGNIEALTREKVIKDWADDMDLCRQSDLSKRDQLCWLLRSIMKHAEKEFNSWVKQKYNIEIEYGAMEYLPDELMRYVDETDLEFMLAKLKGFYIYLDEHYSKNYINEEGAAFVESVLQKSKEYLEVHSEESMDLLLKNFHEGEQLNRSILDLLRAPAVAAGATLSAIR